MVPYLPKTARRKSWQRGKNRAELRSWQRCAPAGPAQCWTNPWKLRSSVTGLICLWQSFTWLHHIICAEGGFVAKRPLLLQIKENDYWATSVRQMSLKNTICRNGSLTWFILSSFDSREMSKRGPEMGFSFQIWNNGRRSKFFMMCLLKRKNT